MNPSPRNYTMVNSNISSELDFKLDGNYGFELQYLNIIQFTGKETKAFLQGQVTCNLDEVNLYQMRKAAQCDLKGRILCLMDILQGKETGSYFCVLPEDLLKPTLLSLKQVALLSRIHMDFNTNWSVWGLWIQNPETFPQDLVSLPKSSLAVAVGDDYYCYAISENRYQLFINPVLAARLHNHFVEQHNLRGSLAWHSLQLQDHLFEIYPETRGLFLPHRVDLHKTNVISFNKGCYKGQEIIARMHYRGTIKHSLQEKIEENTLFAVGQKQLDAITNQEVGQLIDYTPINADQTLTLSSQNI